MLKLQHNLQSSAPLANAHCSTVQNKFHKYTRAQNVCPGWPVYEHKMAIKVINVGSDTFGNPIFQKGLQN